MRAADTRVRCARESAPGTIRGDLATGLTDNAIHASDSEESFERESKAYFS